MARIGEALLDVTDAYRINYEILGNTTPALHAHVFARYRSEPDEHRVLPVWSYPGEVMRRVPLSHDEHDGLRDALAEPPTRDAE